MELSERAMRKKGGMSSEPTTICSSDKDVTLIPLSKNLRRRSNE
jgi:hypothetical protein